MLLDAMKKIDYVPPIHFHTYPAPGPMSKSPDGNLALSVSIFEEHAPFTNNKVATDFIQIYHERAAKANLPDIAVEVQAAASYAAWQILEAGVRGANSFDDKAIAAWIRKNRVNTIYGQLRFDGPGNFGDDMMKVKQVQNGKWQMVWPPQFAAPGAKLQVR
jgi:branched-chain amino acid transport system substrate-binding protein